MRPLATGFLLACTTVIAPVDAAPIDAAPAPEEQQYRAAEPYPGNDSGAIRCESPRGRKRTCEADTRGGARLTKQLSRSPCVEGKSWGVQPGGIWVKAGCRADFALGEAGPAVGPAVLRCESNGGGRRHCPTSTRGGVKLVRQLSRAPCIRHSTWSFDRGSVWVAQGCRAEFQIGVGLPDEALGPQQVRCESDRGRERRCDVGVWKGAQLTRQLSKSPCVQGQTWGWDVRGVWVSRGCRAEFTVW